MCGVVAFVVFVIVTPCGVTMCGGLFVDWFGLLIAGVREGRKLTQDCGLPEAKADNRTYFIRHD